MKNRGFFKGILGLSLLVVLSNTLFINGVKALELEKDNISDTKKEQISNYSISKEEFFNSISTNMEFSEETVLVKGNINSVTTVEDILNNISLNNLEDTIKIEKIGIIDENANWLNSSDIVNDLCSIVFISNEFIKNYKISFWGDFDKNATMDEEDVKAGIDNYLEQDNEEAITSDYISSVSTVVNNNTYEVEAPIIEDIDVNLEYAEDKDIYIEDSFKVKLRIDGLMNNYINVISGNLRYDYNVLKLEKFYIINKDKVIMGDINNNKFIYLLDNYSSNNSFLVMEFSAINEGNTHISLDNLKLLMNGFILNDNTNLILDTKIISYGKGGYYGPNNSPICTNNVNIYNDLKKDNTMIITKNTSNELSPINGDDNSYIENIEIDNYNIDFNKDIKYYKLYVDSNTNSLNINVYLKNDKDSYFITGNENFKIGKNNIIVTLLSEKGSKIDYIIEVNKKAPKTNSRTTKKEIKTLKKDLMIIPIIAMIIIITRLLYKLIKNPS